MLISFINKIEENSNELIGGAVRGRQKTAGTRPKNKGKEGMKSDDSFPQRGKSLRKLFKNQNWKEILGERIRKNDIGGEYEVRRFTSMIRMTSIQKTEQGEDTPKGWERHRREVGRKKEKEVSYRWSISCK